MNWEDTVLNRYQEGQIVGFRTWEDWHNGFTITEREINKLKEAQAKTSFEQGKQEGIRTVVEIVRDWDALPVGVFNKKYKVKLVNNVEDETLAEIIERFLKEQGVE